VLGVIGHVDHGKTALVRALTGQDTDRLPEEKQRGISIALGFAHIQIDADTDIDLIDMPGHERFVRTMISGATGIDAVLLVVSANEGIKPQTIEHIDIAALLGLRRAIVTISKIDLVSPEQAQCVADDTVRLLAQRDFKCAPAVMTSALHAQGVDALRDALRSLAAQQQPRSTDGLVFMPVDRAFSIAGHGPVVTGTLRGAAVKPGDTLELLPLRRAVRVRAVQVHGANVPAALPGQRVALNLRDVDSDELQRGMVLAVADTLALSDWLTISIQSVASAPPLTNGMRLTALLGTSELEVRLRLLDRDVLAAGESGFAQLHCAQPVAMPAGEHVVLRLASPPQTVAGGKVLEPETRRLRRKTVAILKRLKDLNDLPTLELLNAEVQREARAGTSLSCLSQLSSLTTSRVVELLRDLPVVIGKSGLVVWKADVEKLLARIPALLAAHATGLTHDKLLAALPGASIAVLDEMLARLQARKLIVERGKQYFIPKPDEDRARVDQETHLMTQLAERLRRDGLTPPLPAEIINSPQSKRAIERLLRDGVIVRAVDRAKGKELFFHRDAIEQAQQVLAPLLTNAPGLLVTDIAAALGISRKFCMPLLDHLDTVKFTRRIDDRRMRA
jgi:selenocysteine-specific elongation factor